MEVALRQRLEGVATISISESAQTTEVVFTPGDHPFSVDAFKAALKQADVEVVTMEVDACGQVERHGTELRLQAGMTEFVLAHGKDAEEGTSVCVTGRLQEESGRLNLLVSRVGSDATNGL